MDSYGNYQNYSQTPVQGSSNTPKKKKGTFKKILTGALVGIVFGIFAGGGFLAFNYFGNRFLGINTNEKIITSDKAADEEEIEETGKKGSRSDKTSDDEDLDEDEDEDYVSPDIATVKPAEAAEGLLDVSDVVKSVMPSVVSVTNSYTAKMQYFGQIYSQEAQSAGSGIIIGKSDTELLIATNHHVVESADELAVVFANDESADAQIKGTDPDRDLAVIAVQLKDLDDETADSIAIAKLGDSDALEVGDPVIAIGNALGYGQSVTTGVVSALDRPIAVSGNESPYGDSEVSKFIQTDAAINPGNSGGALLNMKGELVGINSSKFAATKVEGIGYAIPIDTAEPILENLMSRETRDVVDEKDQGFLGISCQNVTEEISQLYSMPRGIYIVDVQSGSGAEKAGLKKGDILTKLEGTEIKDYADLRKQLTYYKAGETIKVTVQVVDDNGEYAEKEVDVELSKASDAAPEGGLDQNEDEDTQQNKIEEYDMNDLFDQFFNYGY